MRMNRTTKYVFIMQVQQSNYAKMRKIDTNWAGTDEVCTDERR